MLLLTPLLFTTSFFTVVPVKALLPTLLVFEHEVRSTLVKVIPLSLKALLPIEVTSELIVYSAFRFLHEANTLLLKDWGMLKPITSVMLFLMESESTL